MRLWLGLLALATVALALPAAVAETAHAQTTIVEPPGGHLPYQQWVDQAKVPTPEVALTVIEHTDQPADCGGPALACTDGATLWIAPWLTEPRKSFMHELGHVFAYTRPDLAGFEDERFADIYSLCARLSRIYPQGVYSAGAGLVPGRRLARLCDHLRDA